MWEMEFSVSSYKNANAKVIIFLVSLTFAIENLCVELEMTNLEDLSFLMFVDIGFLLF